MEESWESYVPESLRQSLSRLPKGLREHCERVSVIGRDLAKRHGYSPARAEAAALMHDIARALGDRNLQDLAVQFGLKRSKIEEDLPILTHAAVGAAILRRDYGIADEDLLDAVACHTTGRPEMGLLEQILFLADKLDPQKVAFVPALTEVRGIAEQDLGAAVVRFIDIQMTGLIAGGRLIHPRTVETRNYILAGRACDGG